MTLARRGEHVRGTLHLTPHHLIFSYIPELPDDVSSVKNSPTNTNSSITPHIRPREVWITYPIISFCTLRLSPGTSRPSSIRLRCRDFTFVCFYFDKENKARDVFETIKLWTCKLGHIDKLYAFSYQPPPPERALNGWNLYDPRKEWARLGVENEGSGWRISEINRQYQVRRS